jgi:uncharacterized protein (DUF433 family)
MNTSKSSEGGYYLVGIRISLDSVVYAFNEGQSPETIQENFPALKLSQIYGAIAFYLDHKAEVDRYLERTESEFESSGVSLEKANPSLWQRMRQARTRIGDLLS